MMPPQAATVRHYDGQALGHALEQEIRQMYWQMMEARRYARRPFAYRQAELAVFKIQAIADKYRLRDLLYLRRVGLGRWP